MRTYKEDTYLHFEKCHICGTKNKMRTVLVNKLTGEEIGYIVRCCNCGNTLLFLSDNDLSLNSYLGNNFKISRKECHRLNDCKHMDCPLYGIRENPPVIYYSNNAIDVNKNQIPTELVTNDEINKKYL